jgi:hypothetical protein
MRLVSTKIDVGYNKLARVEGLDELARVLFPGNRNHQRIFLAVFVDLKWAEDQFLAALEPVADKHGLSRRSLETVRAKMRRLGLIDHVSRFNKRYGYREGWVFSSRFGKALRRLADLTESLRDRRGDAGERKDRDSLRYV